MLLVSEMKYIESGGEDVILLATLNDLVGYALESESTFELTLVPNSAKLKSPLYVKVVI